MTIRFLTPEGTLDEKAWAEMCASVACAAAKDCGGSDVVFRSRFSRAIVAALASLPADVRQRAIRLANEHGDFATSEEIESERAELAAGGQVAFEFVEGLDEIAEFDQALRESERLHMLEGTGFKLHGAVIDAAHGGSMTRALIIGMLKSWSKEGLRGSLYTVPQVFRNGRVVYAVLIRSRQRRFCADYQLEISVSSEGAAYAANVLLEDESGAEVLPHTLPDTFSSWLIGVLKAFSLAARHLDSMLLEPPLAESPDWAQVCAALTSTPNKPRR